jgi:hypothetical protein
MKELDRLLQRHGPGTATGMPINVVKKLAKHLVKERVAASHIQKIKNKYPLKY